MSGPAPTVAPSAVQLGDRPAPPRRAGRRRALRRVMIAGSVVLLFVLVAIFGPLVVPFDAITTHITERLRPPLSHLDSGALTLLGTDQVGRDLVPQVIQGARVSLLVGISTVAVAGLAGLALGALAGFYGGALDAVVMRLADIQLGFPTILLAILIAAVLGPSVTNVIITLSLTRWVTFGRVARASTLSTKEREFVLAARALGAGDRRLLVRHILPATITPLVVIATVEVGLVIVAEASLSFLGLGTPSDQPSWGLIVANGRAYLNTAWWISTMPGVALSLVVIAVGNLGDRLRDYLDPKLVTT